MSFSIDGITWEYPCQIERVSEIKASDLSGLMLDKTYFNDVLGTWLSYSLTLAVPFGNESDYYAIYETLVKPVPSHEFVFPYNGGTKQITGRVSEVSDAWVLMPGGNYWKGTRFQIIANEPSARAELGEVIGNGESPIEALPWSGWVSFYIDDNGDLHQVKTEGTEVDFYVDENGDLHKVAVGAVIEYTSYWWDLVDAADGDNMYF